MAILARVNNIGSLDSGSISSSVAADTLYSFLIQIFPLIFAKAASKKRSGSAGFVTSISHSFTTLKLEARRTEPVKVIELTGVVNSIPIGLTVKGGTEYVNWTPSLDGAITIPSFETAIESGTFGGYLFHPVVFVDEKGVDWDHDDVPRVGNRSAFVPNSFS